MGARGDVHRGRPRRAGAVGGTRRVRGAPLDPVRSPRAEPRRRRGAVEGGSPRPDARRPRAVPGSTGLGYAPAVLLPAASSPPWSSRAPPRRRGGRVAPAPGRPGASWRPRTSSSRRTSSPTRPDASRRAARGAARRHPARAVRCRSRAPGAAPRRRVRAGGGLPRARPEPYEGFFARSASGHAAVVLRGDFGRVTRAGIVAHELTHAVLGPIVPRAPLWLAEGLATYMEAAGEGEDGETVRIGAPPPHRLAAARARPSSAGGGARGDGRAGRGPVRDEWLLVHYLLAQHRQRFLAYEGRLARGGICRSRRETFPEWHPRSRRRSRASTRRCSGTRATTAATSRPGSPREGRGRTASPS